MTGLCQGFCMGEYGKFELEGTLLPLLKKASFFQATNATNVICLPHPQLLAYEEGVRINN